jgi:adenylate cyclase
MVLLFIPAVLAVILFEQYHRLVLEKARADAGRIMMEAGEQIIGELRTDSALYSCIAGLTSHDGINAPEEVPLLKDHLLKALQPFLKSTERGIRIWIAFNQSEDIQSRPFSVWHGPPDQQESLEQFWILTAIYRSWLSGRIGTIQTASFTPYVKDAQILIQDRFGTGVSLESFGRNPSFDLELSTPFSSHTLILHRNFGHRFGSGIHVQIDAENLRPEVLPITALRKSPSEIRLASFLGEDGMPQVTHALAPFHDEEAFPIPTSLDFVTVFPEGFFLKRGIPGSQRFLVMGIPATQTTWRTNSLRYFGAMMFLLLTIWAGQHLAPILAGRGFLRTLTAPTLGWFILSSAIPFLVLLFLVLKQDQESTTSQKFDWSERLHEEISKLNESFHQYLERCQMLPLRFQPRLLKALKNREDLSKVLFGQSNALSALFHDGHGGLHAHHERRDLIISRRSSSLTIAGGIIRKFHEFFGGWKKPGTSRQLPDPMEVAIEGLLEDDSPVRDLFMNWGRFTRFSNYGMTMNGIIDLVKDSTGVVHGVVLYCFFPHIIERNFFKKYIAAQAEKNPVKFYSYDLDLKRVISGTESHPPEIESHLVKAEKYQLEMTDTISLSGEKFLVKTVPPAYLENFLLSAIIPESIIQNATLASRRRLTWMVLGGFGALLGGTFLIRILLLRPLFRLRAAARDVSREQFQMCLPTNGCDEFFQLFQGFNEMTEGIRQRERMKRFVSSEVWRQTNSQTDTSEQGPRQIEGAILFSDIRSFTTLSEQHAPEEIIQMLNTYFTAMDRVIRQYDGMIDKLIGDAILAVFKESPGRPHPAERAVTAGLAMRATLSHFNRKRLRNNLFTIDNGIGIHFGRLIEGRVGSQQGRQDLSYFGEALKQATDLEAASKLGRGSRVVVSPSTAAALGPDFPLERLSGTDLEIYEVGKLWQSDPG